MFCFKGYLLRVFGNIGQKVSLDVFIVQGLTTHDRSVTNIVEIPAIVGEYTKSLIFLNNIFIVKIKGNLVKGRLRLVALHLSFTTLIIHSI